MSKENRRKYVDVAIRSLRINNPMLLDIFTKLHNTFTRQFSLYKILAPKFLGPMRFLYADIARLVQ